MFEYELISTRSEKIEEPNKREVKFLDKELMKINARMNQSEKKVEESLQITD